MEKDVFIIYPADRGFAIQRKDGKILFKLPFGSTYSEAKKVLDEFRSKKLGFQLSIEFV